MEGLICRTTSNVGRGFGLTDLLSCCAKLELEGEVVQWEYKEDAKNRAVQEEVETHQTSGGVWAEPGKARRHCLVYHRTSEAGESCNEEPISVLHIVCEKLKCCLNQESGRPGSCHPHCDTGGRKACEVCCMVLCEYASKKNQVNAWQVSSYLENSS